MDQISVARFSFNSRLYYLAKQEKEIPKLDLFSQLTQVPDYPKVYWSHRDNEEKRIAYGRILGSYRIPSIKCREIIKGQPFDPRFYGGRSFETRPRRNNLFESFKRQYFFLPKYEIIQKGNRYTLCSYLISQRPIENLHFESPCLFLDPLESKIEFNLLHSEHKPSYALWEKTIHHLIKEIQNKKLDKVVVARQTEIKLDRNVNPYLVLKNIQNSFAKSSFFCFEFKKGAAFLGATPECLYTRKNRYIKTEAIAGTAPTKEKHNLLSSSKELNEFSFVPDFLSSKLRKISTSLTKTDNKTIDIGYLKHLYSEFEAELLPEVEDENIIASLFPSPALSGFPQREAIEKIKEIEGVDRHWYASPVGWISEHSAELIIAIRSCLISKEKVHLFVGNGIVDGSTPQREWDELNTKMTPFLSLFSHEN